MPPDDATRVRHMVEFAEIVGNLIVGRSRGELENDIALRLALVRAIEVIGEAAAGVSETVRSRCPEIRWREIIATRNRLIHAYFDIELDLVWETATKEVPTLLQQLRELVAGVDLNH